MSERLRLRLALQRSVFDLTTTAADSASSGRKDSQKYMLDKKRPGSHSRVPGRFDTPSEDDPLPFRPHRPNRLHNWWAADHDTMRRQHLRLPHLLIDLHHFSARRNSRGRLPVCGIDSRKARIERLHLPAEAQRANQTQTDSGRGFLPER